MRLALRVERDQLGRKLLHRLACARLEQLPGLAAELRERGRLRVGADVARDAAELLVRDVEAVVAAEREQQVVARDACDLLRLEAEQLADAVILVDDVVAGAQVGERLQRAAAEAPLPRHAAAEDLVVGQEDEAELAPDEAAPRGRDREEEARLARELVAGLEQLRLDAAQHLLRAQRLAAMRERDDDTLPGAHELRELDLGLREPARGDRRPLRFERERLALRERIELGCPVERDRRQAVLRPDATHVVGLEDEVGRALERRDEIVRGPGLTSPSSPCHSSTRSSRRSTAGKIVHASTGCSARCVNGENARIDSTSSPKNSIAERLAAGCREDVDQAAAHRELAAVVDPLDALVARERELLREAFDADLDARRQLERRGPRAAGGRQLGDRVRRRAHEPAARENGQRARSLADEVRRRLEPGLPRGRRAIGM